MIRATFLTSLMLLSGCGVGAQAPKAALELTGRVVDRANLIDEGLESQLTARLARLARETGVQMVVVTTPSLNGQDIDTYSLRLANAWGVGDKKRNDGLMLLVAPNEHKVRIEVGIGLESVMTNDLCSDIIKNAILPRFSAGDLSGGIGAGTDAIVEAVKTRTVHRKAA